MQDQSLRDRLQGSLAEMVKVHAEVDEKLKALEEKERHWKETEDKMVAHATMAKSKVCSGLLQSTSFTTDHPQHWRKEVHHFKDHLVECAWVLLSCHVVQWQMAS